MRDEHGCSFFEFLPYYQRTCWLGGGLRRAGLLLIPGLMRLFRQVNKQLTDCLEPVADGLSDWPTALLAAPTAQS
jgi:hypothetical protein